MSKIEGGPNKLLKIKGEINDKMSYPNEFMKINHLSNISDELLKIN
jgi:hypothetical protein